MTYPTVAVVILNWNGRKFLEQLLPFLMQTTYPEVKWVVADNGSTDDSKAFLHSHYPQVHQLLLEKNHGFAKGYNLALQQVEATYYVLLNSDVEVTPGWIEPVIELMEKDAGIGACQPKILSWADKTKFEYAGASGGWIDALGYAFCRGRVFENCEKDEGQYDDAVPVFWASGCALFVRSAVFHELRGFDETFFAHQEEIDLCWRMQLSGRRVFVCPSSVVYHIGGGSLPKGSREKIYLNYRNSLMMLFKNYSVAGRIGKIPLRLVLDGISAVQQIFQGDLRYVMIVLRAHAYFYRWLLSAKKKNIFPARRSAHPHGIYQGSVVWQYFIRKKRRFTEIVGGKG